MARFRVTPSVLRAKASDLETLTNRFNNEVNKLRETETALVSKWEGPARDKFNEEFLKDAEAFDMFRNGVNTFVQQLRTDADEYDKTENINTSIAATRKA